MENRLIVSSSGFDLKPSEHLESPECLEVHTKMWVVRSFPEYILVGPRRVREHLDVQN